MESKDIKLECELIFKALSDYRLRLDELRKLCKHENTYKGDYSWRIGSSDPAIICSDCGDVVEILTDNNVTFTMTTT